LLVSVADCRTIGARPRIDRFGHKQAAASTRERYRGVDTALPHDSDIRDRYRA
jgi:hypothetical protein